MNPTFEQRAEAMNGKERKFARKAEELAKLRADYEASSKDFDIFSRDKAGAKQKPVNYHEYLRSPQWQRKRYLALKRANFRCQDCNCGGRLEVHHFTYVQLGREQMRQLIVLCRGCHQKQHDSMSEDQKRRLIASIPQPSTGGARAK